MSRIPVHPIRRRILAALFAVPFAGCAPMPLTVYVPEVPAESIVRSPCAFNSHVPVGASLALGAASATVMLARHAGRSYVEVRFEVPAGTTLRLEDDAFEVSMGRGEPGVRFRFPAVSLVDSPLASAASDLPALKAQQVPPGTPLVGADPPPGVTGRGRHFWIATYVDIGKSGRVEVTLPRMRVNGDGLARVRVAFRRETMAAVALFNC